MSSWSAHRLAVALSLIVVGWLGGVGCVMLEEPVCQPCESQVHCALGERCDPKIKRCIPAGTCYCSLGQRTCKSALCDEWGGVCTHEQDHPAGLCTPPKPCLIDEDCPSRQQCVPGPRKVMACRFKYLCSQPDECQNGTIRPCDTGKSGLCASGVQVCQGGYWLSCVSNKAQVEVCNGIDDNCDGKIDNGLQCVVVFAGSAGPGGYVDGNRERARFRFPRGVAVHASGDVYVADSRNHCIRKIDRDGVVTTFAGDGEIGAEDGKAARFQLPSGLVFDRQGNLFVTDTGNHRIRKITPDGVVSTLAGRNAGRVDGVGLSASFHEPTGIAIDPQGHLYVADTGNHAIRKITPAGQVTTLAGNGKAGYRDGSAAQALLNRPHGLVFIKDGSLYITDTGSHLIRWLDPSGQVRTFAGGFQEADWIDEVGTRARFSGPTGVLVDALGFLLVADTANHVIRRISPQGRVATLAGSGGSGSADGDALSTSFRFPWGIAYDESGRLFIADTDNNSIRALITYPK